MKRIDFPIRPHLLKYLQVVLKLVEVRDGNLHQQDYVLSRADRWGIVLNQLLRKPVKSARHEGSTEDCTAALGVNLRNYNAPYYDLLQGKLSPWAVFQFNEFVEQTYRDELYWWVRQHVQKRATIKDAILSFMAFYGVTEQDLAYETLRKDVQRNAGVDEVKKKKQPKTKNFSMNVSQKTGASSQKTGSTSQKTGVLSQRDTFSAVREALMKLPLPLFESDFFLAHAH